MRQILAIPVLTAAGALAAWASVDSGLLALVPAGAKIIGSVDVARARSSDLGQYLLSRTQTEDAHFQEMIDQTGFDPRRDLQSIVFETSVSAGGSKAEGFAILARGNFDTAKIKALAQTKGATIQTYQGVEIIVNKDHVNKNHAGKDHGDQQTAIGFPDVGVAVMADLNTLHQIIENRASPGSFSPAMQSKIDAVGSKNDAWFVSLVGGSFLANHLQHEAGTDMNPGKALEGVVDSSGGVKLGSLIETTFEATTRSAQDASSLADVIRFFASMLQMQRQNDPRAGILASAVDGMTLQNAGTSVHVEFSMPEKNLEQLADMGPRVK